MLLLSASRTLNAVPPEAILCHLCTVCPVCVCVCVCVCACVREHAWVFGKKGKGKGGEREGKRMNEEGKRKTTHEPEEGKRKTTHEEGNSKTTHHSLTQSHFSHRIRDLDT